MSPSERGGDGSGSGRLTKVGAVLAVAAGVGVLVVEIPRFRSGASIEIWLWGTIALFAIALGLYELFAGSGKAER